MIHDEICTYEVCKLAKEKGFDVPTAKNYRHENGTTCNAPTQSLLQRWLREEKKWNIVVRMYNNEGYYWFIQNSKGELQESYFTYADEMFSTYELALEDALKYALENLI